MRNPRIPSKVNRPGNRCSQASAVLLNETEELRRRLADAEAELEFYRSKFEWLQDQLNVQMHARQMLEASVSATYQDTIARISETVCSRTPEGATVLVISKGDRELLKLENRRAWHFPQDEDGDYAGYYPADSAAAIAQLQALIARGGEFLLVPNTAFWWLEHYRELAEWLARAHVPVWRDTRCAIYKLLREHPTRTLTEGTEPLSQRGPCKSQPKPAGAASCAPVVADRLAPQGLPPAPTTERRRLAGAELAKGLEIFCFPIIDWDYRFQRPQHLMRQFGNAGCRVLYLSHQFRKSGEDYLLRPVADFVWELSLRGPGFNPRQGLLDAVHCDRLAACLSAFRAAHPAAATAAIIQSPFWWPLVKQVASTFAWPIVYDCMDHHAGFANSNPVLVEQERELLSQAGLVVASSPWLEEKACRYSRNVLLVRNGCDYEHFAKIKSRRPGLRPVIGYYGAIADWFDSDLVADLAERRPDWDFILVGSTFGADPNRLSTLKNVCLAGEKPYAEIPDWLGRFDAAILPFKRTPLTEATNPVKAYEILAGGKPLVSVPLPEMVALLPLVRLATTAEEFERELEVELHQEDPRAARQRRTFARRNTWRQRFEKFSGAVRDLLTKPGSPRLAPMTQDQHSSFLLYEPGSD